MWQRGKTGPPSERWAKDLSFSSVSEVIWSVLAWASLSSPGRGGGEGIKFKFFFMKHKNKSARPLLEMRRKIRGAQGFQTKSAILVGMAAIMN